MITEICTQMIMYRHAQMIMYRCVQMIIGTYDFTVTYVGQVFLLCGDVFWGHYFGDLCVYIVWGHVWGHWAGDQCVKSCKKQLILTDHRPAAAICSPLLTDNFRVRRADCLATLFTSHDGCDWTHP